MTYTKYPELGQLLGGGRRRLTYALDDPDLVAKIAQKQHRGIAANTREWFLWHWLKSTHLEPLFVPVNELLYGGEMLIQQKVTVLEGSGWEDLVRSDLELCISGMGKYLNSCLRNKRGRAELHLWGINNITGHCQLFDYEHIDREQLALSMDRLSAPPTLALCRPRC